MTSANAATPASTQRTWSKEFRLFKFTLDGDFDLQFMIAFVMIGVRNRLILSEKIKIHDKACNCKRGIAKEGEKGSTAMLPHIA